MKRKTSELFEVGAEDRSDRSMSTVRTNGNSQWRGEVTPIIARWRRGGREQAPSWLAGQRGKILTTI
ncbi:MAG: hypothetical protein KDA60_15840 [Planctomycetales bacterium]|nr:hypothetical protein [Planctomycetales bacterium]